MKFDYFKIRQYDGGFQLQAERIRPRNASKYRHTKADFARTLQAIKVNKHLLDRGLMTLDEVMTFIEQHKL